MHTRLIIVGVVLLAGQTYSAAAQDPKQLVSQAVQIELIADQNDHSRWIYYDIDRKPTGATQQWVAETGSGDVHRVLAEKNQPLSFTAQRNIMEQFIHDPSAQSRQRKSGEQDDRQSADMLRLLPEAFLWTIAGTQGNTILLHFLPNPQFKPPTWESRVFAAMEGSMRLEKTQHRIVSLQGRLVRPVRFCGGLCGSLSAGGTFDVERREIGPSIWQIVETHVHIHGTALFFKNISQEEDEQKTHFQPLPGDISLQQAETKLLQQNG
jgi:hypothetical protein